MKTERPKVGVGVIVLRDNKLLLGKRKEHDESFTWSLPGGHVEHGESPEDAGIRETLEETGVSIKNIRRGAYDWHVNSHNSKHYVTLQLIAEYDFGEATVTEPDVFEAWGWFAFDNLPKPLFAPSALFLNNPYSLSPAASSIRPGIYKHYKGQFYRVIDTPRHTETSDEMVLYLPLYDQADDEPRLFVRPLSMFMEKVNHNGQMIPRFQNVDI